MAKTKKKLICITGLVMLVAAAVLCRAAAKMTDGAVSMVFSVLRSAIYMGLYIAWGISLKHRIIQKQVRGYLIAVSGVMVFWLTVRSLKYLVASAVVHLRYLWYSYYVGMLFIPLLALWVALSLGKPEGFRLPRGAKLLALPTAALLLAVLTNDLHQLVFTFQGPPWLDKNFEYGVFYYPVLGWQMLCACTALGIIISKCRIPSSRKFLWLPMIPLLASVVYALLYISGLPLLRSLVGDLTSMQCLLFASVLECCIQCGLILTNTGYGALFEASSVQAQIVDETGTVYHSSASGPAQGAEPERNILRKSSPIRGGSVVWQEDITELSDLLEQLEENRVTLAECNLLERENYKAQHRMRCWTNCWINTKQRPTRRSAGCCCAGSLCWALM